MIDLSPKALRFARLAAEQQSAFSNDTQVETIRQKEHAFEREPVYDRSGKRIKIAGPTAVFCLRAINGLLKKPAVFRTSDWDANDFAFLQSVAKDLDRQLLRLGDKVV